MKTAALAVGLAMFALAADPGTASAIQQSCAFASIFSPSSAFAMLQDFEITVDPEDPDKNLLFTANVKRGTPDGTLIYVMQLDGRTGMVSGTPRIIADNYTGRQKVNGPEFAYHPDQGMGVLLAGPEGVHAAWRPSGAAWYAFEIDIAGVPFPAYSPPPLPPTIPGRHPKDSQTFGFDTYAEIDFETYTCSEVCYGTFFGSTTTDLKIALEAGSKFRMYHSTLHPLADEYALVTGCRVPTRIPSDCGVFEVQIDGSGGIVAATFNQLAGLEGFPPRVYQSLAATVHPVTGNLVVGVLHGLSLMVWESEGPHAPLNLIGHLKDLASGATETPDHLRLVTGRSFIYANFFLRDGDSMGSYVSLIDGTLHPPVRIDSSDPGGSELVYLPAADRFAIYRPEVVTLPQGVEAQAVKRCWIAP